MNHFFFWVIAACFALNVFVSSFKISRSAQRRIYWGSTCAASAAGVLMSYPTWHNALAFGFLPLAAMTFAAWAATPYINVGGKIYSVYAFNRQPDPGDTPTADTPEPDRDAPPAAHATDPQFDPASDSYSGMLTPPTLWWLMIVLAVIAAGNVYAYLFSDGEPGIAAVGAGLLALLAIGSGYGDGSWRYRIARGQYVPFGIASVITAGSFALVYLIAYYTARRWPLRRTQSMEYRAHPRHWKSL